MAKETKTMIRKQHLKDVVDIINDFSEGGQKILTLSIDECEVEDGTPYYDGWDGDTAAELSSELPTEEELSILHILEEVSFDDIEEFEDCLALLFSYRYKVQYENEVYYFK